MRLRFHVTITSQRAALLLSRYAVSAGQLPQHNLTWRQLRALLADQIRIHAMASLDCWADDATAAEQEEARGWAAQQIGANQHHMDDAGPGVAEAGFPVVPAAQIAAEVATDVRRLASPAIARKEAAK